MKNYPDIQFVVILGKPSVNRHLRQFGETCENYRVVQGAPTWAETYKVRNDVLRWFITDCRLPWLVMLEDDIVLDESSRPFIESVADITSPRIVEALGGREVHRNTITTAAKFSRRAVEMLGECFMPLPKCGCDCQTLYTACAGKGIRPIKAGLVGHRIPMTAWPDRAAQYDSEVEFLRPSFSGSVTSKGEANNRDNDEPREDRQRLEHPDFKICPTKHASIIPAPAEKTRVKE